MISPTAVWADNVTAAWNSGVEAYGNKDYEKAKNVLEEVKKSRPTDPSVYFNLGNTYYKLGDIGQAVLNYESAARLSPRSKDIRKNLEIASDRVRIQLTDTRPEVLRWGYYVSRIFREGELVLVDLCENSEGRLATPSFRQPGPPFRPPGRRR